MSIRTRTSGIMVNINVTPSAAANGLLNGLVSFWELATLNDASPNANNLSWTSQGTSSVNAAGGVVGTCVNFVGGESSAVCLNTAQNIPGFNIAASSFSFAVWFNSTIADAGILARATNSTSSGTAASVQLFMQSNPRYLLLLNDATAGSDLIIINGAISLNVWHLAVVVVDRTAGFMYLSIDGGLLTDNQTAITKTPTDTNQAIIIGNTQSSPIATGKEDQVGWWSRALSQTDVTFLYNSGNGRAYSELTA